MRVLTTRLALGALVLGSVCVLAGTAEAGPLGRLFGRGGGYGGYGASSYGYGGGYGYAGACGCDSGYVSSYGTGYSGGYVQPAAYYPTTSAGWTTPCCGESTYAYGGTPFRYGYGASMYFPSQGGTYAQPMPYAGVGGVYQAGYPQGYLSGGVYQSGYPQGYQSGAIPGGGFVPGQLPSRPQEGVHEGAHQGTTTDTSPTESKAVSIKDGSFDPSNLNIPVGTTVKWTNNGDKPHTVTSDKGDWGSEELAKGQTFTATFTKAGTFEYHCKLHPDMKAKITVK